MADYYSHRDPRKKGDQYLDYDTGSGAGWIWAVIVVLAFIALLVLGTSGGNEGTATDAATPAAAGDTSSIDAPATATTPVAPVSE